jgi:hypothetical protein
MPKKATSGPTKSKDRRDPRTREKLGDPFVKAARAIGIDPTDEEYERSLREILPPRWPSHRPRSQRH